MQNSKIKLIKTLIVLIYVFFSFSLFAQNTIHDKPDDNHAISVIENAGLSESNAEMLLNDLKIFMTIFELQISELATRDKKDSENGNDYKDRKEQKGSILLTDFVSGRSLVQISRNINSKPETMSANTYINQLKLYSAETRRGISIKIDYGSQDIQTCLKKSDDEFVLDVKSWQVFVAYVNSISGTDVRVQKSIAEAVGLDPDEFNELADVVIDPKQIRTIHLNRRLFSVICKRTSSNSGSDKWTFKVAAISTTATETIRVNTPTNHNTNKARR